MVAPPSPSALGERTSLIEYTPKALKTEGAKIAALADAEGFFHHAAAVRKRIP